jgi:hypothetical protein
MITNDAELKTTLERITWFQEQVIRLRATETNPASYHAASGGFLTEIDRMQRDVREYLSFHPLELAGAA